MKEHDKRNIEDWKKFKEKHGIKEDQQLKEAFRSALEKWRDEGEPTEE